MLRQPHPAPTSPGCRSSMLQSCVQGGSQRIFWNLVRNEKQAGLLSKPAFHI